MIRAGLGSLLVLAALGAPLAAAQRSALKFEVVERDIGTVFQHDKRQVEFPFTVEGATPVRFFPESKLVDFHTSCGCTDAYLRPDWLAEDGDLSRLGEQRWDLSEPIPAGARGTIVASFQGKRYSNTKESTIAVRGTMSNTPVILTVRAQVEPVFRMRPAELALGKVPVGDVRAGKVSAETVVRCHEAFEILEWTLLPDGLRVEEVGEPEVDVESGAMSRRLRFTLSSALEPGPWNRGALATTSLDVDIDVLFSAEILAPVQFDPTTRLHFGFPRAGEVVSRTVAVDLQVEGATLPAPTAVLDGDVAAQMEIEVVAREAGKAYDVLVRTREDAAPGRYTGTLRVSFPEGSGFGGHALPVTITIRKSD